MKTIRVLQKDLDFKCKTKTKTNNNKFRPILKLSVLNKIYIGHIYIYINTIGMSHTYSIGFSNIA